MCEGSTAVGVEYLRRGEPHQVRAKREVILSAGAIGSPQIRQLSGIGAKSLLDDVGIPLVGDLPGVGRNLQDHLQIRLVYKTSQHTLNNIFKRAWVGLQYLLNRTGPLTLAASQVAIFTKSNPRVEGPDIQFHMQPLSADKPGQGAHKFSAFTSSVCQVRPYSRGHLAIRSRDPLAHPAIHPNFLSDERLRVHGVNKTHRRCGTLRESIHKAGLAYTPIRPLMAQADCAANIMLRDISFKHIVYSCGYCGVSRRIHLMNSSCMRCSC